MAAMNRFETANLPKRSRRFIALVAASAALAGCGESGGEKASSETAASGSVPVAVKTHNTNPQATPTAESTSAPSNDSGEGSDDMFPDTSKSGEDICEVAPGLIGSAPVLVEGVNTAEDAVLKRPGMEKFLHGHMAALKAGIENGTVVLYKDSVDGPVLDKDTSVKVGDDVEFESKC
jgi:hypothetical protein